MVLQSPLSLLFALLAIPIILLYILRLQRQVQVVSSTMLWRRVLEDAKANAPWQRLRPSLLLLLQLLVLAVLVLALARPAYSALPFGWAPQSRSVAGNLVIIVDQSFTMQAQDRGQSRFERAIAQAIDLAGQLGSGSTVSVIGMGAQPYLAVAGTDDMGAVTQALQSLRPESIVPNISGALSLARSLAGSALDARVIILTSRESGIGSASALGKGSLPSLQIIRIGDLARDLAITAFSARDVSGGVQAVLQLRNFGPAAAHSDLDLWVDDQLADVRPVDLGPGGMQTLFWSRLPAAGAFWTLHARLSLQDDMAVDKNAWAVASGGRIRKVALVTGGDYFLQAALGLAPAVQLTTVPPAGYRAARMTGFDLIIFDGLLPRVLPTAPALLINPPAGALGPLVFGRKRSIRTIAVTTPSTQPLSGILRYVDLTDVSFRSFREASLPPSLLPLALADRRPLIAVGTVGGTPLAVITTDPQASNWPLRLSYPIVMRNLLDALAPASALGAGSVTVGHPIHLTFGSRIDRMAITLPDGTTRAVNPQLATFSATDQPGVYRMREHSRSQTVREQFSVNTFFTRSRPVRAAATTHFGVPREATRQTRAIPVSLAWVAGLAAILLLSLEWWLALRR